MTHCVVRRRPRLTLLATPLLLAFASSGALAQGMSTPAGSDDLLPPNASAGECYARVWVPAQYETRTREVLRKEASAQIEVVAAVYETVEEQVLVKEATTRLEIVPARYETVEEQVLVKPAEVRYEVVPAEYQTVQEEVLIKEAYTTWKVGRGPIERIDTATGEIMCLVEVPAEYATVEKTVLVAPATVREVEIPAEYMTVEKEVVVEPERTVEIEVPAEYATVTMQKLVTPAQEVRTEIPEEFDLVEEVVQLSEGHLEWRSILCETNTTPDIIRRLQVALGDAGYNPGPVDGSLGGRTTTAVRQFQEDNGLPAGQLTMETLHELGVMPRPST